MLVHDMQEGLLAVHCAEQDTMDCSRLARGGPERNMTIITPALTSVLVGGLGSSQNRGVTTAPPASPGNLDDMPSSGQNSTDFLGAGVQKKNYPAVKIHPGKLEGDPQKFSRAQGK